MSANLIEYFIHKFTAIPPELWTDRAGGCEGAKRCAALHCHANYYFGGDATLRRSERDLLHEVFKGFFGVPEGRTPVVYINDGHHPYFGQANPRDRVIAALRFLAERNAKPE